MTNLTDSNPTTNTEYNELVAEKEHLMDAWADWQANPEKNAELTAHAQRRLAEIFTRLNDLRNQ